MGSIVLLDLMGGVALLLWGLHMVLSGVLRAFGPDLHRFLSKALGNRFTAFPPIQSCGLSKTVVKCQRQTSTSGDARCIAGRANPTSDAGSKP
jgi:hypothetical protein